MKNNIRITALLLLVCTVFTVLVSCNGTTTTPTPEHVDYAASVTLDMNSTETKKQEVTVNIYIDGDTTHFKVPSSIATDGVMKARYLAINTPESTGRIEPWGNEAAAFTKEKLMNATSIVVESDKADWEFDSNLRHLVWIWYKPEGSDTYRNLNIEILQNGYAVASNSANNRYGSTCMAAIEQAKREKLVCHSDELDPDFPYGEPTHIPLSLIRQNIEGYYYNNVYFEGTIVQNYDGTLYIEDYDEATEMYYGITAYYGTAGLPGPGLNILQVGNRVRMVGVVTYFEGGDIWQISDLYYSVFEPDDPNCFQFVSSGHEAGYPLTTIETFYSKKEITKADGTKQEFDYAELALNTSISMENLKVTDVYTTAQGNSKGAMTLTCSVDGKTITVRTEVLKDAEGNVITADYFKGKTIDVKGMVEKYDGKYQIKLFNINNVVVK